MTHTALPSDEYSIENAIILQHTKRTSLIVDPQGQASKFIKNLGKMTHPCGLKVIRGSDDKTMSIIETCAQAGKWVVLETSA